MEVYGRTPQDARIARIAEERNIDRETLQWLLATEDEDALFCLRKTARETADRAYGKRVFLRGLIEFTNYCRNDCYYCGIRRSSPCERYRLNEEQILSCCGAGYELGFRTFVLQGGEDAYFTDGRLCGLVSAIKERWPDCALTLSVGERSRESYQALFDAGADRYLLRHETADAAHYRRLHPAEQSLAERKACLLHLKEIGYQVGCGFMVGSPGQTVDTLYADLQFIRQFNPHMVGIGPFIPQKDTPFGGEPAGTAETTVRLLSVVRLLLPRVLLPATTALGTIHPKGRQRGILAGANVVMPNLSPMAAREKYRLYDNKAYTDAEAAECRDMLREEMREIGYEAVCARGDYRKEPETEEMI